MVHAENLLGDAGLTHIHMVLVISAGKKLSSSVETYYNNKQAFKDNHRLFVYLSVFFSTFYLLILFNPPDLDDLESLTPLGDPLLNFHWKIVIFKVRFHLMYF